MYKAKEMRNLKVILCFSDNSRLERGRGEDEEGKKVRESYLPKSSHISCYIAWNTTIYLRGVVRGLRLGNWGIGVGFLLFKGGWVGGRYW